MSKIPNKTHAVILPAYNSNLIRAIIGLNVAERELSKLNDDEVLIKMEAAPCNPSDIAFIRGGYNIKKSLPAIPGFEGAGVVEDAGNNAKFLIGKRVSSFTQEDKDGTWANYFIAKSKDCIVLNDKMNFEQGACLSINPFTAYGLVEFAKKNNCKAIVQNAGGGQVAEFIRVLASFNGIEVINIVRKEEHVKWLREKENKYILDSSEEDFEEKLAYLTKDLRATIAYDAVGGEATSLLLRAMPKSSTVVLYGGLSGKAISDVDPFDIIFEDKKLVGFNLNLWNVEKTKVEFDSVSDEIQNLIINGKMKTEIRGSFQLDNVVDGIRVYIKSMSAGKVLFKP